MVASELFYSHTTIPYEIYNFYTFLLVDEEGSIFNTDCEVKEVVIRIKTEFECL